MIKISALNKETEEESRSEEEVTKEALEQIALQQYAKALELHRKGNLLDATQLLRDLLETELLDGIKKPAPGEKIVGPLFNLKYLSHKNLASMLAVAGDVKGAIEEYCAAAELDDTDVTLWHRLGVLCMRAKRYEMALQVFQRGAECNPKHWPCLDKIITLLFGLDSKEECIVSIYDALKLDPDYLRGLAYRRYIYTNYHYVREYMEYLDPMYKWNENDDEPIDTEMAEKLIKEAEEIHETFLEQQRADAEQYKCVLPILKLVKPISSLTWESVGDSLVHMHHHMTHKRLSHACPIEVVFEKEEKVKPAEVSADDNPEPIEVASEETSVEAEKVVDKTENVSENEINDLSDKDKNATDTEKVESDVEIISGEPPVENAPGPMKKKPPARRRGSALSFLEQWEWCTKRRSGRKKPVNRQDHLNDNIYDMLRRMVPICLAPDIVHSKDDSEKAEGDTSEPTIEKTTESDIEYFASENEQKDVKDFINKYTEKKCDIIDMLNDFLNILADRWKVKWPESLIKIFIEANICYNSHIDVPANTDENNQELLHYTNVHLLVEEFSTNEKLNSTTNDKQTHSLSTIETIGMTLSLRPHIFIDKDILELMLRYLWVKLHIHILNKCEESALDCLYQLSNEFEAMGEYSGTYSLNIINFKFKPDINENEILAYIKFLERNKQLSTVLELYDRGYYEEVLSIVIDSFEHCKNKARKQEEEMSLDFAVQLSLILDTYWALDLVEKCFKWSLICLHEALKHYFRFTSGSPDYEKWTVTVVKILCCMEHILITEGLSSLEAVSRKELSQGLEDLIRIIGHQVETNAADMPFGTVIPWIIMHFVLQREEDQGRGRTANEDIMSCDDVPNPLMVLFIAHEQLGNRSWCCKSDGKLLYFILDTVVPRLRSPALAKSLEQVCQYMEQCVYCLYGHPGKKSKVKYLADHNAPTYTLDWKRAQQLYEIFRPLTLPELEGKVPGISADTEQLFLRILDLLPPESHPQKYVPEIEKYIKGMEMKLPLVPPILPYKMKDIYFLLGDYYFKKEEGKMAIKYNMYDVIVNNDRLESWAEISLAKAVNLERILNSCKNLNNEKEFLTPAKSIIRCFKRSLELDPTHCNMWIEYGIFVYTVHSFCSRLLKQASESLSMEDFGSLEKQKEDMLDTTHKCFMTVLGDLNNSDESDKANEDSWLHYYMLGKVAEKRIKLPSVYLDFYMQGVKSLQETDATYPLKINYSSPTRLCIEVLELHYRIHASILKYIEQHESKPIPSSVGKVFANCIEKWRNGPFMKKPKKEGASESDLDSRPNDHIHAANILKRSVSDAGEDDNREQKRMKIESAAAKVKRSASYDTEALGNKETPQPLNGVQSKDLIKEASNNDIDAETKKQEPKPVLLEKSIPETKNKESHPSAEKVPSEKNKDTGNEKKSESSSSSSSSSSDSSSSSSSSESSSDSSRDSETSTKSITEKPLPDEELMKIVSACLDALEDCASRFPPHYKAIYRLAHYHFYYKKGKDIERCRDLMLSNFTSRAGQRLGGLFSERKPSNFFNNIWKIPLGEVDRAGGFAFHMNRSVLLTMEILKEIDDHKTLLDLSLHLQRIPEPDKKYLRDSDREELAQQAFSLCVQSLKGQLLKFSQQADLKSNDVERQALKSLMLDIYRAYQRAQKQPNSKQFTNLLIEAYKLVSMTPITENINMVDISMKYCQCLIQALKQQATQASLDKSNNAQKKHTAKAAATIIAETVKTTASTAQPKTIDPKVPAPAATTAASATGLPKMSAQEMATAFQSFLPALNDPVLSQQTAAALSYLRNISALAGYTQPHQNPLHSALQNTLQNSFQAEFYRQFLTQSFSSYNLPPPAKKKRGPKPGQPRLPANASQMKLSKSFSGSGLSSVSKAASTHVSTSLHKSMSTPLAPSAGTVVPNLPVSMTANMSAFGVPSHSSHSHSNALPAQAHMSSTASMNPGIHTKPSMNPGLHTKPPMPHQLVSPGKTLQEKLAERQKNQPSTSKNSKEISASISKLPSSLTITKTSVPKQPIVHGKKSDAKKALPFSDPALRRKPITSDEVIVLDDD